MEILLSRGKLKHSWTPQFILALSSNLKRQTEKNNLFTTLK